MILRLLFSLIVGAIAGWIASLLVAGSSFGLGVNLVVGMVGAAIGRFILPTMGFGHGMGVQIVQATLGAVILLVVLRLVKRL